jgi:hypothetical protein
MKAIEFYSSLTKKQISCLRIVYEAKMCRKLSHLFLLTILFFFSFVSSDAQNLVAVYNFDGNFTDELGGSTLNKFGVINDGNNHNNYTESFGTDVNGTYWNWTSNLARGGGIWIDLNTNISTSYSIGIKFSFSDTEGGYRKIIDYKNLGSDNGFYFYSGGKFNFYPNQTLGTSITNNNEVCDMIVTRDGSTNVIKAFIVIDNILYEELNVSDIANNAVPTLVNTKPRFRFFHDDNVTTSEATPGGKVYSIKVWDGPITEIGEAMNNLWTGTENSMWNNAANWSKNTIPTIDEDVEITISLPPPIIESGVGANCNNLTINSDALLTIHSGGSLITNGAITNNGTINIQRTIVKDRWHLISSPVTNSTAGVFNENYLQSWSEANHSWTDIIEPQTLLSPVEGFGLWSTYPTDHTFTFTGTPNTGNQSKSITFTEYSNSIVAYEGANLLGNPYPSAIDWSMLDNTYGAAYYWQGNGTDGEGTYLSWNDGSGSGSQYIAPMQGFFIVAPSAGTFSLSNANRTHTVGSYYKSEEETKDNLLVLETVSKGISDKLFVNVNNDATEDFDLQHDAYKFASGTPGLSELYSYTGDKKLSIDVRPACEVVLLGFSNSVSGNYSIGISQMNGISKATLEDTKTNTFSDLLKGSYAFSWLAGEDDHRFKLHLSTLATGETESTAALIYSYRNTVYISLNDQVEGDIFIYNIAGQLVATKLSARGMNEISISHAGNYIVKVVTDKENLVRKIWIP